jgi:hypothetical protein
VSALTAYDWALVRVVPRVETGDGEAVGAVLHARRAGVFVLRLVAPPDALAEGLAARWPGLDATLLACALRGFVAVAEGAEGGGPLGLLPPSERFHWLAATRSTVVQAGPVRTGVAADPAAEADRIAAGLRSWGTGRPVSFSTRRDPPPPPGV